jgi:hypothetical protein
MDFISAASKLLCVPFLLMVLVEQTPMFARRAESKFDLSSLQQQGEAIFQRHCQKCHGPQGEGTTDGHQQPLVGDASIGQLARVISETMPEQQPENCIGAEARAVAAYIHQAFYGKAARIRNRPPRISLTHLTADQLRQSIADLYARQAGIVSPSKDRGIHGVYYDGSRQKNENRKIDRVDATINFQFNHDGPGEGINAKDFFVQWRGGVKADVTGRYQIVIRSSCAFLCYFGSDDREFINNRVQSGEKTEFQRSIFLTAGRVYPIRIDYYQRKRKTKQPPANITLSWKPPHGQEEVIPTRNLIPNSTPAAYALQAKLPPDDRSYGYERGVSVDAQWDRSTTDAALEFGRIAADELWPRFRKRHREISNENRGRLRIFLRQLVETAFRGPLNDETLKRFVDDQLVAAEDDSEAIRRCVLLSLKSPRFLYPLLDSDRSQSQRVATRLALTLFDSLPSDEWLRKQVRDNRLEVESRVRAAALRMVNDVRTQAKTRQLMYQWLNLRHGHEIIKNEQRFPGFDKYLVADLKASFDAFLDDILWSEASSYQELFLADWAYTTKRMEEFYGHAWKVGESSSRLTKAAEPSDQRIGILSHPYLMSSLAYQDSTSPIHRGVFLIRHILGRTIRPPNEAFTPLSPDLHPDLTTRERVQLQTSPHSCQVCHVKINALGFTLENYDAVGRFRDLERGRKIDPAGSYTNRVDKTIQLEGPKALAEFLSQSDDAERAFINRAFLHFVKQPPAAFGPETLDQLIEKFRNDNHSIRALLVEIAVVAATEVKTHTTSQ